MVSSLVTVLGSIIAFVHIYAPVGENGKGEKQDSPRIGTAALDLITTHNPTIAGRIRLSTMTPNWFESHTRTELDHPIPLDSMGALTPAPLGRAPSELTLEQHETVTRLARQLTAHSLGPPLCESPEHDDTRQIDSRDSLDSLDLFKAKKDSKLDPFSPNFDAMAWARRIMDIYHGDAENNPLRSVGVGFKNLSVFGYGSDSEYQPTVANIVLSLASQVRQLVSSNKRKVSILNNFDGLLEAGEMLVVLGPPGRWADYSYC